MNEELSREAVAGEMDRSEASLAEKVSAVDMSRPYVPLANEFRPPDTPMWLSHHWPEDYERCAIIGRRHVCRRCLFLYPMALVAAMAAGVGWFWSRHLDPVLVPLLPLPAVIEFVLDALDVVGYSPRRQAALTLVGAVAAGAGYVRYLDNFGDPLVWATVLVYGAITASSVVVGRRLAEGGV